MKYVQHARSGDITKLPNEDAHLLVSSGRYVYSSKFESRKLLTPAGRSLPWRIFLFVATLLMVIATLMLTTSARAADLKVPKAVPYKACLTQAQAREVYPGKHLKYREVQGERCWFAGTTLPKTAFIPRNNPRATGVAVIPARQSSTEQQRVQVAPDVSITTAGDSPVTTNFTATLVNDAFRALTGMPEAYWTFDAMWARAMRDAAGMQ